MKRIFFQWPGRPWQIGSLIIGDKRLLQAFGLEADETHIFEMGRMMERLEWLKKQSDSLSAGILVSGRSIDVQSFPAGSADISGCTG